VEVVVAASPFALIFRDVILLFKISFRCCIDALCSCLSCVVFCDK
jgi:hypothetical protein